MSIVNNNFKWNYSGRDAITFNTIELNWTSSIKKNSIQKSPNHFKSIETIEIAKIEFITM